MTTELAGELLAGRYVYERELGRGASGRVVRARDTADGGALRAIKLVDAEHAERLRWELGVLSSLSHPALARVFELLSIDRPTPGFDAASGGAALVTELAEGEPSSMVARGLAREPEALIDLALRVGTAVGSALAALHRNGLVHGDVKPDNIVVDTRAGRCKLVDLGLAGRFGSSASVGGTPGFMAPEVMRGERDGAADVFALGCTLHHLLRGAPDSDHRSRSLEGLLRDAMAPITARPALPEAVPAALRTLLADMLVPEPASRPRAREVLARLLPMAQARGAADSARGIIGGGADDAPTAAERAAAVLALPLLGREQALERLCQALAQPGLHVVCGPPGSGRSRLIREAVWRVQSARLQAGGPAPTYRLAVGLDAAPLRVDSIVHLNDASVSWADAQIALRGAELEGVALALVLECEAPLEGHPPTVALAPFAEGETRKLLELALPGVRVEPSLTRAAQAISAGLPGRLCRMLAAALAAGIEPTSAEALRAAGALLAGDDRNRRLPEGTRALAEALCLSAEGLSLAAATEVLGHGPPADAVTALCVAGLATRARGQLRLRPDVRDQCLAGLERRRLKALASRAPLGALDARARMELLLLDDDAAAAAELATEELARLRALGQVDDALALGRFALDRLESLDDGRGAAARLRLAYCDALRASARYDEALMILEGAVGAAAHALRAELQRLTGDSAGAAASARRAQDSDDDPEGAIAALAQAIEARLALDAGELERALALASEAARSAGDALPARLRACEVEVLAQEALGAHAAAMSALERGLVAVRAAGSRAAEARLCSIAAQLARSEGDLHGAARRFASAFELADGAGEQHAAASFLHNVGMQRLDCGEPGPAITALREAARRLARMGRDGDLGRVLYNLAYAAHLIGVGELASDAAARACAASEAAGDRVGLAYAICLQAELALSRGERRRAGTLLRQLPAAAELLDHSVEAALITGARAAAADVGIGDVEAAQARLQALDALAFDSPSVPAQLELGLCRVALALERGERAAASQLASAALALADRVGAFDAQLRALLLGARAADTPEISSAHLARVRGLLDIAARGLEPADRARLRAVDAYRVAFEAAPLTLASEPAPDRWRELAGVAKELAAERRPARLHERILDAAIRIAGAERGYLVLLDRDGRPRVRAGRGIERVEVAHGEHALSRSIVSRVLGSGRPLSTMDAAHDERLAGAQSVHALSLRSVLAVPLRIRGEVRGAIYLEDRLRPFAFGPAELALLADLSELAGIALDSAEALRSERRALRRQSVLRARLARTVEAQAIELHSLKRTESQKLEGFAGIVADSPAMGRVLSLVRKVASSDVPVLVRGESGTGKELIARALHSTGARAQAPFVTENCGAIPESLLESALFGHVRGAFTGADRKRQGLFEVADRGTLFLDEIGEMTPSMQARLLRVLQDGEIRPVGGERARKVDVRVVAATHRDLESMVADGSFRQDLYYRLAVVTVDLPPLRERTEDIPALIQHFVDKYAGAPVEIDARAQLALSQHAWPGNVRELENEVRRALVLAEGSIGLEQLSPGLLADAGDAADPLDLKGQINQLERRLIRQALDAAAGNQTHAARMLGVSRYGLQKMLRRLGLAALH